MKVGRKPCLKITPELIRKIEDLSALGLTVEQVASSIGIGESTFYKYKAEKIEIQDAIKRGQAKGVALMANRLIQQANNGSVAATIFYLKCHGWKESSSVEITAQKEGAGLSDFYKFLSEQLEDNKK